MAVAKLREAALAIVCAVLSVTVGEKVRAAALAMVWAVLSVIVVPLTFVTVGAPETPAPDSVIPMTMFVALATVRVFEVVIAPLAVVEAVEVPAMAETMGAPEIPVPETVIPTVTPELLAIANEVLAVEASAAVVVAPASVPLAAIDEPMVASVLQLIARTKPPAS